MKKLWNLFVCPFVKFETIMRQYYKTIDQLRMYEEYNNNLVTKMQIQITNIRDAQEACDLEREKAKDMRKKMEDFFTS